MWKRQDPEDGMLLFSLNQKVSNLGTVTKQLFIKFRDNRPATPPVDQVDGTRQPSPAEEDTEIWVLLTRHLSNSHRTQDFIALRVQVEDDVKGAVVLNQQMVCRKETYTNSTHILVSNLDSPSTYSVTDVARVRFVRASSPRIEMVSCRLWPRMTGMRVKLDSR
jgi:calpain-7